MFQYLMDKVFISHDKDLNVQFVKGRQDIFALAIVFQIIFLSKSYFVQPNVVSPVPAPAFTSIFPFPPYVPLLLLPGLANRDN